MTTCTLTDDELIEKTRQRSIKVMEYEGLNWATPNISTDPNEHPELLVIELGRRFALANETLKQFTGCGPIHIPDKIEQLLWWRMEIRGKSMFWLAFDRDPKQGDPIQIADIHWKNNDKATYSASIRVYNDPYRECVLDGNNLDELKAICEAYYAQHKQEFVPETTT